MLKNLLLIARDHHLTRRTVIFSTITLGLSLAWLALALVGLEFSFIEPLVTSFGLISAFFGLVYDPYLEALRLKKEIVASLFLDNEYNKIVIKASRNGANSITPAGVSYNRVRTSAVDRSLVAGVFQDTKLVAKLAQINCHLEIFNATLAITEFRIILCTTIDCKKEVHESFVESDLFGKVTSDAIELAEMIAQLKQQSK